MKQYIWFGGLLLGVLSLSLLPVMALAPPVSFHVGKPSKTPLRKAALGYRDHVPAFQKYGTMLFMQPLLHGAYDTSAYITQKKKHAGREHFIKTLTGLLQTHDVVDVFLAAHGNTVYRWVSNIPAPLRKKLRLVYNTGCENAYQAHYWKVIGARAYVSHKGAMSISPIFLVLFMREWVNGTPLQIAVDRSNRRVAERLHVVGSLSMGRLSGAKLTRQTHAVSSTNTPSLSFHSSLEPSP